MSIEKELADKLDAQERLERRGYKRKRCPHCMGQGFVGKDQYDQDRSTPLMRLCHSCGGKGFTWEAPITR